MVPTAAREWRREAATQEALVTADAVSADDRLRAQLAAENAQLRELQACQQQVANHENKALMVDKGLFLEWLVIGLLLLAFLFSLLPRKT